MIKNERQFKITRSQRDRFKSAIDEYDPNLEVESGVDPLVAQLKLEQLQSEYEILCEQIDEYESLTSGTQTEILVGSIRDLPQALIKARIIRGWTQADLADNLNLKAQQIQRYEAEDYSTANLSTLERVANALELDLSSFTTLSIRPSEPAEFPINEMYRRGWFEDYSGTLHQAKKEYADLIEKFFFQSGYSPEQLVRHRQKVRCGSESDDNALMAWQARIVGLTKFQKLSRDFAKEELTADWFRELAMLSQYDDGPLLAREKLLNCGIHFIVERHLPRTYLDGAAIRHPEDGAPIVAITARYDRLDNFWFVLFHELAHICLHFDELNSEDFFDDLDVHDTNEVEKEADNFALEHLLPGRFWNNCLSRFSLDAETVREEADQFNVHASIVAGRIRHERKNYSILNDAIGHKEVLRNFRVDQ